jgi:hypothetical protein
MSLEGEGLPADTAVADDTTAAKAKIPGADLRQASVRRPAVEPLSEPPSDGDETSEDTLIPPVSVETKPFSLDPDEPKPGLRSFPESRESSEQQGVHPENKSPTIQRAQAISRGARGHREGSAATSAPRRIASSLALKSHLEPSPLDRRDEPSSRVEEPPPKIPGAELREPAPKKIVFPQKDQRMPHSVTAEPSMAKRREHASPPQLSMPAAIPPSDSPPVQVVIERLEIEVVPPAPQPSLKPAPQSEHRMEAARPQRSVSKIGPLSPSTAFRHYLSLRYR